LFALMTLGDDRAIGGVWLHGERAGGAALAASVQPQSATAQRQQSKRQPQQTHSRKTQSRRNSQ
ncbi:MAG TPA: hypothetical protein PK177_12795, partial [Burkholderiaceae bacterium]|nr:hypothetical protein [Burkholderiaceae bacterium]